MSVENAIAQVRDYLQQQNSTSGLLIEDDLDLIESGVLDSLRLMTLVIVIETVRGRAIAIEEMSVDHLRTVNLIRQNFFAHQGASA
jgi:acyl carrier protein